MTPPGRWWAIHPGDQHCHALDRTNLAQAGSLGYAEALCGAQLPADDLEPVGRPWGTLCLPCVLGAAADLVDPGRMGTAL